MVGLQRVTGLSLPLYGGNFIKDPMGVWQGNELLAGLQRVAGLKGFTVLLMEKGGKQSIFNFLRKRVLAIESVRHWSI